MLKDYSNRNLQKASFKDEDLRYASFMDCDIRGADFTGANLTGADFTNVKTGITIPNTILLFFVALVVSLLSGYVAMLAGQTMQTLLKSEDINLRVVGILTLIINVLFIVYAYWIGLSKAIKRLFLPFGAIAAALGIFAYVTKLSSGLGMAYMVLTFFLVALMFIVGTIARVAAGSLSNILFILVAVLGSLFGKSVGGGIGTVVMAIACAMISKRALKADKGFETLKKVACYITSKFGTSFRNTILTNTNFSQLTLRNCDFTDSDVSTVNWNNSVKKNCIITGKSPQKKSNVKPG